MKNIFTEVANGFEFDVLTKDYDFKQVSTDEISIESLYKAKDVIEQIIKSLIDKTADNQTISFIDSKHVSMLCFNTAYKLRESGTIPKTVKLIITEHEWTDYTKEVKSKADAIEVDCDCYDIKTTGFIYLPNACEQEIDSIYLSNSLLYDENSKTFELR